MNAPVPQVRMDKSSDYSTVYGERPAGDRHAGVHFYQDGLPFDARGVLIPDHPEIAEDTTGVKQKKVEKLLKAASKMKKAAPGDAAVAGEEGEDEIVPVNLESWARGEGEWPWLEVTQAIARRFARRVSNKVDALELLIAEKVIAPGDLSAANKKLLDSAA